MSVNPDGSWSADVSTQVTDDMGEAIIGGLTPGTYPVVATCTHQDESGRRVANYNSQLIQVAGSIPYVALGDSFTAGQGLEPFEPGSVANGCHRSDQAYPRLLSADLSTQLLLSDDSFVACSGAVSDNIKDGAYPQMDKVRADTGLVTMTIGGNDMPVEKYVEACITQNFTTSCAGDATNNAIAGIADNVIPEVRNALEALKSHMNTVGSNATVLVLGYPQIVSEAGTMAAEGCFWYDTAEAAAMRSVTQQLNAAIEAQVTAVGGKFHFVSATESNSPFADHELCRATGSSFFQNYEPLAPREYTFHPNAAGQQAYVKLVKNWLAQHPLN
jgi:lysophospholipase L1-like esterase